MQDIDPPIENGNRIKGKITLNSSSGAEPDWSSGYCDGATWSNNVIIDWDYSKE